MRIGLIICIVLLAFPQLALAQAIPPLPESRTCHRNDVVGMWQLQRIYEVPPGQEMRMYDKFRYQYVLYYPNDTYTVYVSRHNQKSIAALRAAEQRKVPWLWQFVVDKTGFLFIYRNGKPEDTQACFIVVKPNGSFIPGEMLLMPPKGKINGRLIKVYKKIWSLDK